MEITLLFVSTVVLDTHYEMPMATIDGSCSPVDMSIDPFMPPVRH
jgi:hypothetical protein